MGVPEFRAFITALAREHTVVRYDRPGTGLSDRPRSRVHAVETDRSPVETEGPSVAAEDEAAPSRPRPGRRPTRRAMGEFARVRSENLAIGGSMPSTCG
jgi:hypothetical protein